MDGRVAGHHFVVARLLAGASGVMTSDGETYRFGEVVLRPRVVITEGGDAALAEELHRRAHGLCFIARSVNFAVRHEPEVSVGTIATS